MKLITSLFAPKAETDKTLRRNGKLTNKKNCLNDAMRCNNNKKPQYTILKQNTQQHDTLKHTVKIVKALMHNDQTPSQIKKLMNQ